MNLPAELLESTTSSSNPSKRELAYKVYDEVSRHFVSGRFQTYLRFWDFFRRDLGRVWATGGFCHCTQQNRLIREALLTTNLFQAEDIKPTWGLAHFVSPHQWLRIKLDEEWIDVDSWGRHFNVPFGENASGFRASWRKKWRE